MTDRIVPDKEIEEQYIVFCKDLGAKGDNKQEIDQYLKDNNLVVERRENNNLIWFEQIENGIVKYYSQPIMKYIQEPENEMRVMLVADNAVGHVCLPQSAIPLFDFRELRKNKIPKLEIEREKREYHIKDYQYKIDRAYEYSIFGYIIYDGKELKYPQFQQNEVDFEYAKDSQFSDNDLLKQLLSNKERYSWYQLEDRYFIVRNSQQTEYQYLANEETQEIKLAKIVGDKVVLEDIIKDELTTQVEKEIDDCLRVSQSILYGKYIRFNGEHFEIVKIETIPLETKEEGHYVPSFLRRDYRRECSYEKVNTELTIRDIQHVVCNGDKYKWFSYRGWLYISSTRGSCAFTINPVNRISDSLDSIKCIFDYNNNPNEIVQKFIDNGIFDGDEIIAKYKCGQESLDNIIKELIRTKYLEKIENQPNKYKITPHCRDVGYIIHQIENELHL